MKAALLFLPGAVFGAGLALSGMCNPAKVINFLDVAGNWDPSLLCVMGGAVLMFAVWNVLVHKREKPILGGELPGVRTKGTLNGRTAVGAALFGIGWGVGGVCPGPALTDLSLLRSDVFAFVGAMLVGMVVAQRVLGADAPPEPQADAGSGEPVA